MRKISIHYSPDAGNSNSDVSILVTEASPEVPFGPNIHSNQTLIHHVIVHRESEEYHDLDEVVTDKPSKILTSKLRFFKNK
jgi:hypothetical protein